MIACGTGCGQPALYWITTGTMQETPRCQHCLDEHLQRRPLWAPPLTVRACTANMALTDPAGVWRDALGVAHTRPD
jgi:hypothetical protein